MGRSHLKVYFSFEEETACLSDAEKSRLLLAMVRYARDGADMVLSGNERFLWPVFKAQIDRDIAVYDSKINNGSKGGRPKEENRTKPNETEINRIKPNETENDKIEDRRLKTEEEDKDRKRRRFTPPSVDEVAEYCRERGNGVDPEEFISFYESKGWLVGNQPMKNWRAAIVTWEKKDKGRSHLKAVPAQNYAQRDYSGEQDDAMDRMIALGENG